MDIGWTILVAPRSSRGGVVHLGDREGRRPHAALVEAGGGVETEAAVALVELRGRGEEADHLAVEGPGGHPVPGAGIELRSDEGDDLVNAMCVAAVALGQAGDQLLERRPVVLALLRAATLGLLGADLLGAGAHRVLLGGAEGAGGVVGVCAHGAPPGVGLEWVSRWAAGCG